MTLCLIPISQIKERIGVADVRTVQKWCEENDIKIHMMHKKKCIYNIDLENALEMTYIKALHEKHPDNYKELYEAMKNKDFLEMYELQITEHLTNEVTHTSSYKPMGENAQNFQKLFNSI